MHVHHTSYTLLKYPSLNGCDVCMICIKRDVTIKVKTTGPKSIIQCCYLRFPILAELFFPFIIMNTVYQFSVQFVIVFYDILNKFYPHINREYTCTFVFAIAHVNTIFQKFIWLNCKQFKLQQCEVSHFNTIYYMYSQTCVKHHL